MNKLFLKKLLIAALLIFVPLYPKFPLINVTGTYVSIRAEDFIVLILGVVTFAKFASNFKKYISDNLFRSFLVFFLVGFVAFLSGFLITHTVTFSIGLLHLIRRVEYMVPLLGVLILFDKHNSRPGFDFFAKILMIIVLASFVYGFGQKYFHFPIIDTQNSNYAQGIALRWTPGAHINATFAGHYDLASFMVLVLPFLSTLFFLTKKWKLKIVLAITLLSGFWLLGASLSRISLASWMIASIVALILVKKYKAIFTILVVSILIVAFFPSFLGRYTQLLKIKVHAATNIVLASPTPTPTPVSEDRSTSIRLNVEWPRAMSAFYKNPILGTGYSSLGLATDSDYLRSIGEVGVLGSLAFVLVFVRIAKELFGFWRNIDKFDELEKSYISGVVGSIIGIFVTSLFLDIFEASKFAIVFWFMVGYAILLIRVKTNE